MTSGRERLARTLIDRATEPPLECGIAEVTAVDTGAGTDGNDVVTVLYLGATLKVPHLLQYTPVVGHMVALLRCGGTYLVLGRPGGHPSIP